MSDGKERTENYSDYKGECYAVYILQNYQRKGVGHLLMKTLKQNLEKADIGSMMVWVLAENQSRKFYEKLGGKIVDRKQIVIGGTELTELAYGWADIKLLLND